MEAAGRVVVLALTLIFFINSAALADDKYYTKSRPYVHKKKHITNLHFYFHDTLSGKNPSAILVAKSNGTTTSPTSPTPFGTVFAIDDPLTVSPNKSSEVIGNVQGLYVSSGQDVLTLVAYFDFGFTKGEFNGSSISVFSRNPVTNKERELAVVGGRGKFRMARGFALLNTYFVDMKTGDAIVEYNVTVIH
ncbi:dirigent protein 4-like [Tripterygium wilfordii]|uniref:dirigent protein 4-like n=1 Tax=Tripterygium wilfordii TaxID=458696 RepID=UPI0018F7FAAB|nr:dirigent protein 4-like [Tripterygium wilfordii]